MIVSRVKAAAWRDRMTLLRAENVRKIYRGGESGTIAVDGVSLEVQEGEFVMLTGKSGCGKTTLLNLLGGMEAATSGSLFFEETDLFRMNPSRLAAFRNRNMGFVFQAYYLIDGIRVIDNVELPLGYAGVKKGERRRRAGEALRRVALEDRMRYYPSQLSGGQQQRTAIARAIVNQPRILLADEPTGALDSKASDRLLQIFEEVNEDGQTILMVTHSIQAASRAGRVMFIKDGCVFNQIYRGSLSDDEMYRRISDTLTVLHTEKKDEDRYFGGKEEI